MANKENNLLECNARVALRLPADEKFALQRDAKLASLSMSELIRRQYFHRPIVSQTDEIMLAELLRLGRLLKHVHNQTNGAYKQQTLQVLADLSSCIRRIGA